MSERISPYKLGMTMTRSEYGAGLVTISRNNFVRILFRIGGTERRFTFRQTRSRRSSSYVMSGNSLATSRQADRNMPSDIFLYND